MKSSPELHKLQVESLYGTKEFKVALFEEVTTSFIFQIQSNRYTFTANHDFVNNSRVRVSVSSGGSLPGNLVASSDYYVVGVSSNNFGLSATKSGDPITCSTSGTGTFTVTEQPLNIFLDSDLNNWVRHEVLYYGTSRQSVTFGSCKIEIQNNIPVAFTDPKPVVFQPITGSIVARYIGIIRDGSLTYKDSSGVLDLVEDYQSSFTIAKNTPKGFSFMLRKYSL